MALSPIVRKDARAPRAPLAILALLLVFYVLAASVTELVRAVSPSVVEGMTTLTVDAVP